MKLLTNNCSVISNTHSNSIGNGHSEENHNSLLSGSISLSDGNVVATGNDMRVLNTFVISDFATQTGVNGRDSKEALSGCISFVTYENKDTNIA